MQLLLRRAPRAGLSSPATLVVAAVVGAAIAFVAAAASLQTDAARSAAVIQQLDRSCAGVAPATVDVEGAVGSDVAAAAHRVAAQSTPATGSPAPVTGVYAPVVRVGTEGGVTPLVRLAHRDRTHERLRVVAGGGRDGLWVPASFARKFGVGPGDRLTSDGVALPPVSAVHADLTEPLDGWWCSERSLVIPRVLAAGEFGAAPVLWLPRRQAALDVLDGLDIPPGELQQSASSGGGGAVTVRFPQPLPRTPSAAEEFAARTAALQSTLYDGLADAGIPLTVGENSVSPVERAAEGGSTVRDALLPLTAVSLLVGLVGVAAVAVQWCQRRAAEVRLLWVRGRSPAWLGLKAVAELAAPMLLGSAVGFALARGLLPYYAPSTVLDGGSTTGAALAVLVASLAQLGVLGAATALRVRATHESVRWRVLPRAVAAFPWELVAIGLAVWAWVRLQQGALTVVRGAVVPRIDPLALAFPLLATLAVAAVAARLTVVALRASHRVQLWRWPPVQLALRRLAAGRRTVAGVLAVAALGVGTIAVGTGVAAAQQEALLVKADLIVGSRTAVAISPDTAESVPRPLRGAATAVGEIRTSVDSDQLSVLVVDPATIDDAVQWRETYGDTPLEELLPLLERRSADGVVPALRVGDVPSGAALPLTTELEMTDVGAVESFPGLGLAGGGYVIARSALDGELDLASWELWSGAGRGVVLRGLTEAGVFPGLVQDRDAALDALPFLVITWTFDFCTAIGVALAVLATTALLLTAESRRRQNALSGALSSRMGLRLRALTGSHALELGAVAFGALAVGAGSGLAATALAVGRLDPAPRLLGAVLPPDPGPFLLLAAAITLAVVALASTLAVRGVRTARIRELIRA